MAEPPIHIHTQHPTPNTQYPTPDRQGRNVARTTVMIDPEGKVLKVWADIPESQVESNPMEALQFTQQLLQA